MQAWTYRYNYDILCKARPALYIIKTFKKCYFPSSDLAMDKAMIGFKGRFHLKLFLPGKPKEWGIDAWGLADTSNWYLLRCQTYWGKQETKDSYILLGEQVVLHMTEECTGKYHHVYLDISLLQ
jgi:hypothetical protein